MFLATITLAMLLLNQSSSPVPPFSWLAFVSMLVVAGVSVLMFVMLVRRWTSHRQWVSLSEWGRERGFRLRPAKREALPEPLMNLLTSDEQIRFHLCDPTTTLVQFEAAPDGAAQAAHFNALLRRRAAGGAVGGLRPAGAQVHLIELLPMRDYPSMTLGERFVIYGSDLPAARRLADSPLLALLPPDIGLILLEQHVMLEFSSRPFDPIEFGRMIALADQLGGMVV